MRGIDISYTNHIQKKMHCGWFCNASFFYSLFFIHRNTLKKQRHSCSTDYARKLDGLDLTVVTDTPYHKG